MAEQAPAGLQQRQHQLTCISTRQDWFTGPVEDRNSQVARERGFSATYILRKGIGCIR